MAKGIFLHKADSVYDDVPAERYQFPAMYLDRARALIGAWIVYKGTEKSRHPGYFAVAKVEDIIGPSAPGMYLALIEPGSYLDCERIVPLRTADGLVEREAPNLQWAVRPLSIGDFNRIIALAFPDEDAILPRLGAGLEAPVLPRLTDAPQDPFILDVERDRTAYLSSRIVRDRVFRKRVLPAYDPWRIAPHPLPHLR